MNISFNEVNDSVYIRLKNTKIIESEAISPGIICDFDTDNEIVGVEILGINQKNSEQLSLMAQSFSENDKQKLRKILSSLIYALA